MSDQLNLELSIPETYADTLGRVDYEANGNRNVNGGYVATYDELHWSVKDRLRNSGRAVAAQVLQDVMEAFGSTFTASNWRTDEVYLDDAIKHFATERGIDLEDGDE